MTTKAFELQKERRDRWVRLGVKRTDAVLKALATLERCGNRGSYDYTEEEVERAFHAIDAAVQRAREAFRPKQERIKFTTTDLVAYPPGQEA